MTDPKKIVAILSMALAIAGFLGTGIRGAATTPGPDGQFPPLRFYYTHVGTFSQGLLTAALPLGTRIWPIVSVRNETESGVPSFVLTASRLFLHHWMTIDVSSVQPASIVTSLALKSFSIVNFCWNNICAVQGFPIVNAIDDHTPNFTDTVTQSAQFYKACASKLCLILHDVSVPININSSQSTTTSEETQSLSE